MAEVVKVIPEELVQNFTVILSSCRGTFQLLAQETVEVPQAQYRAMAILVVQ